MKNYNLWHTMSMTYTHDFGFSGAKHREANAWWRQ